MTRIDKEIVQIVFVQNPGAIERIRYLLRKAIPHKVYFVAAQEEKRLKNSKETAAKLTEDLEKELPKWVVERSEKTKVSFFDFTAAFSSLIEMMAKEMKEGRQVYVNIHGCSRIVAAAALVAANVTGAKAFWIEPDSWEFRKQGEYEVPIAKSAKAAIEITMPVGIALPGKPDSSVLKFIHSKGGVVKGRLATIADEIGLENLGANVKKSSSGVVKLSKTIGRLRESGYITTRKLGRKSFEIALTPEKGKAVGEIVSLMS